MRLIAWPQTDVGRVRDHNEDSFLVDRKLNLFIVCDGMGGHAAGEFASAIAVNTVEEVLSSIEFDPESRLAEAAEDGPVELTREKLRYALRLASKRIFERAEEVVVGDPLCQLTDLWPAQ